MLVGRFSASDGESHLNGTGAQRDEPCTDMKHLAIFLLVAAAVLIEVQGQIEPCLLWMKPRK
uniref:Uncharacterized protein n=1 Tax=Anopheles merus TaxID=30066 RepID=A0A182V697_ANOME